LQQLATYAKTSLETIEKALQDQLTTTEDAQKLIALEESLIQQNQSLVAQIDSLGKVLPGDYVRALENIKKLADGSLSAYASVKDQKKKLEFATSLDTCFHDLSGLTTTLGELPAKAAAIDSLYQDSVWNPFMAVVMDEEVKKRLTATYNKVLLPYFVKKASTELDCQNAGELNHEIQRTNTKMKGLREEDTKKLERKLRREKDPKTILQLLDVQPKKANQ